MSLKKPWMQIAIRVAGSWVFASGLLMLDWMLKGRVGDPVKHFSEFIEGEETVSLILIGV